MHFGMIERSWSQVLAQFCGILFVATVSLLEANAARAGSPLPVLPLPAVKPIDFAKDIQPILSEHCYACHGPDKQKGDLRWDVKQSAFKTGEHGPIIVPGNSAASRVIKLVSGLEPDTIMAAARGTVDRGPDWAPAWLDRPGRRLA
jgi:hypothetical protein